MKENYWITSKEAKFKLKISGCELMHRREDGEFEFKKVGNQFFYLVEKDS